MVIILNLMVFIPVMYTFFKFIIICNIINIYFDVVIRHLLREHAVIFFGRNVAGINSQSGKVSIFVIC